MLKNYEKKKYLRRFKKIVNIKDSSDKEYFDKDGCGLEIEFGIRYERPSVTYTEVGLQKLVELVSGKGKFVIDNTIGTDLNLEIVLNPYGKEELKPLLEDITDILEFYDNFVVNENCGVHANFRADDELKKKFYNLLVEGHYEEDRFTHNKYKVNFNELTQKRDGTTRTYEEFIEYQNRVSSKYTSVNFLKKDLVEFRALDLDWENIEFVIDIYEKACAL
ncbi:MAG: hypothetical protein E7218_08370 [Anaerofustis stercorihominis]|nr:hypothetical protein [Anaerofustis stercorihominis]